MDKGGPRLPLVVGPAIAGAAFLFMAFSGLSDGPSHYWVTFFPGVVLLGIGMGITVAPLTTSVMSSVATHFAGTASGINNAVSRTAGVLAIAVVGAVALIVFSHALQTRSAPIDDQRRGAHGTGRGSPAPRRAQRYPARWEPKRWARFRPRSA